MSQYDEILPPNDSRNTPPVDFVHFPDTSLPCFKFTNDAFIACVKTKFMSYTNNPMIPSSRHALEFPGPQPMSIDRSHFKTLTEYTYLSAPKTDGVRACLFFTEIDGINYCFVFDRSLNDIFGFRMQNVPRVLYQGSILDCELVKNQTTGEYHALIFDAFVLAGFPYFHFNFTRRMRAVCTCMSSYVHDATDSARMDVKTFYEMRAGMHPPTDSRFFNDGYIFMPDEHPVVFGRHDALFKLKTVHSVDFLFRDNTLFSYNTKTKRHVKAGIVCNPSRDLENGYIVECVIDKNNKIASKRHWKVIKIRMDKDKANSVYVMEKTLLNSVENLVFEEILQRVVIT